MKLGIAGLVAALLVVAPYTIAGCSSAPSPNCPDRRDGVPDPSSEVSGGDACARAASRLELGDGTKLNPKPCADWRPNFAIACRKLVDDGIPICPGKLARIKSCAEVAGICR